jgi:hypothetical protein
VVDLDHLNAGCGEYRVERRATNGPSANSHMVPSPARLRGRSHNGREPGPDASMPTH